MIWPYIMKITLFLLIAGFLIEAVIKLVRPNRDWVEIAFYFVIALASLFVYLFNFHPFAFGYM